MDKGKGSLFNTIGLALTRIVVPLWILAGAVFKLYDRTPQNLPSGIRAVARMWSIDLELLMRSLIGLELFAAAAMVLVPRVARPMAIFMLSCFCAILIWEMARASTKCGCFGDLPIQPWQMLLIDGSLLAGVIVFRYRPSTPAEEAPKGGLRSILATALLLVAGLGVAFAVPNPPAREQVQNGGDEENGTRSADPTINPAPMAVPATWYIKEAIDGQQITGWIGKPWRQLDLFRLMARWPKDMDEGKRYVVFYSRTCEHCETMFYDDLTGPLDAAVVAVEIPFDRTQRHGPGAWSLPWQGPPPTVEMLELPLGCSYVVTPPIALTIENGLVTCAVEGDHKACLGAN